MKNYFYVTFLLASIFMKNSLSDTIKGKVVQDNANVQSNEQIRNARNDLGRVSGKNNIKNIRGMSISNLAPSHSATIEDILYDYKIGYDNERRGIFERKGYDFEFDAGNPDVHGEIRRPCQAYDSFCIRKFFADHSKCKISGRDIPDPLYRASQGSSVNFASNNMSETQENAIYGGLNNARISEFYINKVTDNLIIAITFDSASKFSNNTYMKFYTRGREPIVTTDAGGIQYSVLTVTVIIPQLHNLRLDRSEIYTHADNNIFPFALGARIAASTDPEVLAMYARFYTNIPVEYQEEISNQGSFMVGNYIQYTICDFGLKVL